MNNIYRAYWEKVREQSLKLAQYYTPESLVELSIDLLQPDTELFDPCCGLGSFLLKAKERQPNLKIRGNDIDNNLGDLPFAFSQGDYLLSSSSSDFIITNIPFNQKNPKHCHLVDNNFCWIERIINDTNKKALIILPSGVNSGLNKKITEKRIEIINSGVLELVCQLPSHLFNQTGIAPCLWLINKEKTEKDIYFLNAERFSEWENKKRVLTVENRKEIVKKENWIKADYEVIKEKNFILAPIRYEPLEQPEYTEAEIDEKLNSLKKKIYIQHQQLFKAVDEQKQFLENLDKDPEYLKKSSLIFEGGVDLDWLLSDATPERLQQELELLVNEYYELWTKMITEINQILG